MLCWRKRVLFGKQGVSPRQSRAPRTMSLPIKLISTDFDGTLFAEFESPPIPEPVQQLIGDLQSRGAKWVINTGRDMSGLMEALARSGIAVEPDYLVLVEREIYCHAGSQYLALEEWNAACSRAHVGARATRCGSNQSRNRRPRSCSASPTWRKPCG